jgi:Ca2+-binding EF-hand superfamily protein|eukprot:COSAG06_NODE_9633_length_1854_cov_30.814245_1_plen_40_part_00
MVRQLMSALDKDGGGTIDFPEFEALFIETQAAKAAKASD